MKILRFLIPAIVLTSCVSTKYSSLTADSNFDQIEAGTKYTFYDKSDQKYFMDVTSVEKDSIIGTQKNQKFSLAKNDIKLIKKNRPGATVAVIGVPVIAVVGTILIITSFIDEAGKQATGVIVGGIR